MLHLDPGAAEQVEVLVEQTHQPQARLIFIVKAFVEEDVRDDIVRCKADDKRGVKGLAWKTGGLRGRVLWARQEGHFQSCEETL